MSELRNRGPQPDRGSNAATLLALGGILLVAAALMVLIALVQPAIFGILLVVFGFVLIGALQYVVWGWWLPDSPSDEDDDELERNRRA